MCDGTSNTEVTIVSRTSYIMFLYSNKHLLDGLYGAVYFFSLMCTTGWDQYQRHFISFKTASLNGEVRVTVGFVGQRGVGFRVRILE